MARLRKDGKPDKRYKSSKVEETNEKVIDAVIEVPKRAMENLTALDQSSVPDEAKEHPQQLLERLLQENNLKLDFDVVSPGTVATRQGYIKITEPTLVVKASYNE